jgi:hypothetical protein
MDSRLIYLFVFAAFLLIAVWLQKKHCILCDASTQNPKPYSYARLQLVWWSFIVFASFVTIIIASGQIPTFHSSTLILLGIGALTTTSARIIDISDDTNYNAAKAQAAIEGAPLPTPLSQNNPSQGFFLDLVSDKTGVSIHRFQALVFNLVFGVWFIYRSVKDMAGLGPASKLADINKVMPVIDNNNLLLLGLSAGTYAALKITENKV